MTGREFEGVWPSNVPLDENEGAWGPALLSVKIPVAVVRRYEWVEEGKPYREFLVPAKVVNRYGPVRVERTEELGPSKCVTEREPE